MYGRGTVPARNHNQSPFHVKFHLNMSKNTGPDPAGGDSAPPLHLTKARSLIKSASRICVLTGAGVSAASGIKTFRDAGGLWEDHSIQQVATPEGFAEDPALVWRFYNARRKAADIASPNAAHLALARMELNLLRQGKKNAFTILTQNVDGLHQQAGSQNVIELHGSVWLVRCTDCGEISEDYPLELPVPARCDDCGALLRPHIVWFGESLDEAVLEAADAAVQKCDLFLVIGTSAVVQPAASFPLMAGRRGVPVIEVNTELTPLSVIAAVALKGPAEVILPALMA
jgi:NAD-dependent deacetylase